LQHLGQVLLLFGRQAAQHFRAGTQNKTGPNHLAEKAPRSAWIKLLDQFRSFLVLVLLGATVLAGVVGDVKDAVVIGIVLSFLTHLTHCWASSRNIAPRLRWRR
jgi:Ca2+-transporting ATPase